MPVGGGHHALRDSFLESLQTADPQRRIFDPVVFNSSDTRTARFYGLVVNHVPWFQGVLFDLGRYRFGVRATYLASGPLRREVLDLFRESPPDVAVSTHFLLSMMFVKARDELGLRFPVVNAIPDYGETVQAFYPEAPDLRADYTIVMDRKTEHQLLYKMHHPPSRLHLGGFRPRPEFRQVAALFDGQAKMPRARRLELIARLKQEHPQLRHFDPEKKTLIFLGGSAWTEKTMPVIAQLLWNPAFTNTLNVIVVSGKNEIFRSALANRVADNPRFSVFGFVPPKLMAELQAISDVPVLGSIAPASMHELMELRCGPLMLFHYIPGNETEHVTWIREKQIGLYEPLAPNMLRRLMEVTGFVQPGPEIERLVRNFPARAMAVRRDHEERANELPGFLANVADLRLTALSTSRQGARARVARAGI